MHWGTKSVKRVVTSYRISTDECAYEWKRTRAQLQGRNTNICDCSRFLQPTTRQRTHATRDVWSSRHFLAYHNNFCFEQVYLICREFFYRDWYTCLFYQAGCLRKYIIRTDIITNLSHNSKLPNNSKLRFAVIMSRPNMPIPSASLYTSSISQRCVFWSSICNLSKYILEDHL